MVPLSPHLLVHLPKTTKFLSAQIVASKCAVAIISLPAGEVVESVLEPNAPAPLDKLCAMNFYAAYHQV